MITCLITSPDKTTVYEKVASVTLPASWGQMQILPGHSEAFVLLTEGNVVIRQIDKNKEGEADKDNVTRVKGGECYVKDNKVTIIL